MTHEVRDEVIIVDDDVQVQRALQRLLSSRGFTTRVFGSAKEFLENKTSTSSGACLVLDIEMPDMNGMDLQARLFERKSSLPIIFITGHGTIPKSVQAMQMGAVDFLEKPVDGRVLIEAIRRAIVSSNRKSEETKECFDLEHRFEALSHREREVYLLVIQGYLNKQIAAELGIVEQTVKVHRARVMEKMKAHSLAELIRMADTLRLPPCSSNIFASPK